MVRWETLESGGWYDSTNLPLPHRETPKTISEFGIIPLVCPQCGGQLSKPDARGYADCSACKTINYVGRK
jgi:hypothetical protein